jgi:hypothetical protein
MLGFFIFLIPLLPKLPIRLIDYTYIGLRYEDLYIALFFCVFLFQLMRKKIQLQTKFLPHFLIFWVIVFISNFVATYYLKTTRIDQLGLLHSMRRFEYMIIFFIATATVKTKEDFFHYLRLVFITLALVSIYGLGQKILGWPAVQTMNPEYAKGYLLTLDANARISSTFAGHYDFAAYLVFLIPLTLGFFISTNQKAYFLCFVIVLINLTLTASRVSYIAYIISNLTFLIVVKKPKLLFTVALLTICFTYLSGNLTKRLNRTFQEKKVFVNKITGQTNVAQKITVDDLPAGNINSKNIVKKSTAATMTQQDIIILKEQIQETLRKEGKKFASKQEELDYIDQMVKNYNVVSTVLPDISVATRLQVEWPRAIKAFLKYPLLGIGPSNLTEATDNDYLRLLGEFGILGFLSFFYLIFAIGQYIFSAAVKMKKKYQFLFYGCLFGIGALLINASYIDVFEASKVAYTFWMIMGIYVGVLAWNKIELFYEKK